MTRRRVCLSLRAAGLGDLLTVVPALRALARALPEHEHVLATPPALAPLARLTGAVDRVVPVARPEDLLAGMRPEARGIHIAVNLHGSGPRSHRALAALHPRHLIAYRCPGAIHLCDRPAPRWIDGENERARWLRLLAMHGVSGDADDLDLPDPGRPVPAAAAGATLLHPGAGAASRSWPPERWAAVARAERRRGRAVVLTGSATEIDLVEDVRRRAGLPAGASLAGATDVLDLASLVAAAGRVVCGDTGVAHLATALGTPSVVLFGPTSPAAWGPPPERRCHRVVWRGTAGDPHGDRLDPGLAAITVEEVVDGLRELEHEVVACTAACRPLLTARLDLRWRGYGEGDAPRTLQEDDRARNERTNPIPRRESACLPSG